MFTCKNHIYTIQIQKPSKYLHAADLPSRSFCGNHSMSLVLFPRFFGLVPENLKCTSSDNESFKNPTKLLVQTLWLNYQIKINITWSFVDILRRKPCFSNKNILIFFFTFSLIEIKNKRTKALGLYWDFPSVLTRLQWVRGWGGKDSN